MVICVVGVRVLHLLEGSVPPRRGVRQVWSRDATELPRPLEKVSAPIYFWSLYCYGSFTPNEIEKKK